MAAKAKAVDWEQVELEYRAGVMTKAAIGKAHGISPTAVNKRAKAEGWSRDLSKRIDAERESKVSRAMVSTKVLEQQRATDEQVVQANAQIQADTILEEVQEVKAFKQAAFGLVREIAAIGNGTLREALAVVLDEKVRENPTAAKALHKAFDSALSLGGRAFNLRNAGASLATAWDKERLILGIDKSGSDRKSLGEFLDALA